MVECLGDRARMNLLPISPARPPTPLIGRRWGLSVFFALAMLAGMSMRAPAATDWAPFTEPLFEHLGRNQGLPNDVVGRIVQDSTGFLWFGTGGGLVRFDGHRFRHFTADPSDPTRDRKSVV